MDELAKITLGETEGVMKEAYKDLVSPSAKPVGTVLSYLPRTIRLCFSRWEKWIINGEESLRLTAEALKDKVVNIPEDKQCEPEPYVAIPAIQQISYCYDSEVLRDMYANLLASSMNLDKKWTVHPAFVDIIKQLTPDEAKILKSLPRDSRYSIPLIDLNIVFDKGKGRNVVARNITMNEVYESCETPDSMCAYLDNLERLKLIKIADHTWLTDDALYEKIEKSDRVENLKEILPEGQKYGIGKKLMYVTEYGVSFIRCCIEE